MAPMLSTKGPGPWSIADEADVFVEGSWISARIVATLRDGPDDECLVLRLDDDSGAPARIKVPADGPGIRRPGEIDLRSR